MHDDEELPASAKAASARADRNLLFGVIALQNDFITREQLVAAFDAWVHDKSRGLAEILEQQGALSTEDRGFLDRLVEKFLAKHGNDAEKSLAALSAVSRVRPDLERLNDRDLGASLGHVGKERPPAPQLASTLLHVSGTPLGRFRILRPHAKGGLGQVSVALDQELNREVALKEIQPQHADSQFSRERFVQEAEITGGLEHPGIVPVYALGQGPDGRPFYAMRFVKGDNLKQAIEIFHQPDNPNRKDSGARQLALRQLLGRFIDVCNAMEYAHSRGVLHRDLKPGNIMVGKYGETLVVDWGLAKVGRNKDIVSDEASLRPSSALSSSGQTQPGAAIGTPAYMSPEQAAGKLEELGPASDVYSLGATLYHVLCGKPPFEKDEHSAIVAKVQRGDFPKPQSVASEVPAGLEAICLKAMALDRADRYRSARSLADDLEHWLADEPVTAALDSLSDLFSRYARKHRGYFQAGALAVVLVAVVSVVAAIQINNSRKAAVELAGRNEQLAIQKGQLADSEREAKTKAEDLATRNKQLADEKGALAEHNARLAEDERKARSVTERQLRIATAERLARMSHTKRSESPEVSLLLAIESGRATRHEDEGLLPSSHQALLDALSGIGGRPLAGHQSEITSVAISPDSRWIVTGSKYDTARLWDLTAENPAANPRGLGQGGGPVAMSSDSRWIVTGGGDFDTIALVWDLAAENPAANPRVLSGDLGQVNSVAISADGRWIVTASVDGVVEGDVRYTARIWDLTAENPAANPRVLTGQKNDIGSVAISADSHWIVTASRYGFADGDDHQTARVWDLTAENPAASVRVLTGHKGGITSLAISPDSRWIVTGSSDKTARVWDLTAETPAANPRILSGHQGQINSVAISAHSRWIVTGSEDMTARVWDLTAENPADNPRVLSGHQGHINSVAISADSRWIVTGSYDKIARVWDLTAANPAANPHALSGHQGQINSVAISPDGRWIVTGSEDKIARVWDLTAKNSAVNPRLLSGHQHAIVSMAMSPDSRWVVTGSNDETARVWDLTAKNPAANPRVLTGHQSVIISVAISPDSRWIVTGSEDKTARIWDLAAENPVANPRVLSGHEKFIHSVAISPNNRWIVTVSGDHTARVWDLTSENPAANPRVVSGQHDGIGSAAISPDGRWVVTASRLGRHTALVWDLTAENPAASPRVLSGHQESICSVAISPDSRWIVTGSWDKTARVWDLTAKNPAANPRVLTGHQSVIISVAISPDSRWIVTGSEDKTARVWDLTAENPAANPRVLSGHQKVIDSVAISSDSRSIVTGSADNTARVWDLKAENPAANPRVLTGHQREIVSVVISPDSRWIVTGSLDSTARVWLWRWDDLISLAGTVGRNFDRAEWELYFSGEPYHKTFSDLPIPGGPQTAMEYATLGSQSSNKAEYEDALIDFAEAIRLDPNLAEAYNGRAWLFAAAANARFRDGRKAIADATKACELTEWKNPQVIDTLAAAYAEAGDFKLAVKWQTNALELVNKIDKRGFRSRLKLYKASTAYRDGQPDEPIWAKHLAAATESFTSKNFGACIDECRAAIAIDADKPGARELLIKAALSLQDWQTVDVQSQILIDENPQAAWVFHEYGSTQAADKKWSDVAATYVRAVRLAPDEIWFLYYLAVSQRAAGDVDGYRHTCRDMLDRFGTEPTRRSTHRILVTALPGNGLDPAELLRLAKTTALPGLLGPALCRAGQYAESLKVFAPGSDEFRGRAWEWLFVAIAQHGAGQLDLARGSLKNAREWIVKADGQPEALVKLDAWGGWWERAEVSVLLAEVEKLLAENSGDAR